MQILTNKVYRNKGKTYVKILLEVEEDRWHKKEEMQARLEHTLPWMGKHLIEWADFDEQYSLNLFTDALQALGEGLIRWDNCVSSQRNGRRAMAASKMLQNAYGYESWSDKSYRNWSDRHKIYFKPYKVKGGLLEVCREYTATNAMGMDEKAYSDKMWKVIFARQEKTEANMKKEAWAFLIKHFESLWD